MIYFNSIILSFLSLLNSFLRSECYIVLISLIKIFLHKSMGISLSSHLPRIKLSNYSLQFSTNLFLTSPFSNASSSNSFKIWLNLSEITGHSTSKLESISFLIFSSNLSLVSPIYLYSRLLKKSGNSLHVFSSNSSLSSRRGSLSDSKVSSIFFYKSIKRLECYVKYS